MGKALIFLLLGTFISFSVISVSVNENLNESVKISIDNHSDVEARYIANSMVNILITQLSDSTSLRYNSEQSKSMFDGSATYTMKDTLLGSDSLVQIRVTAKFLKATKTTTAYVRIPSGNESVDLPPFLDHAICGGEEVKLNGQGIRVRPADASFNSDIHSNDQVNIDGSSCGVEGFVTFAGSRGSIDAGTNLNPPNNPDGLALHRSKATVNIPKVESINYRDIADESYGGGIKLSGNIMLGTRSRPHIIYVGGDLQISGVMFGYGIIVVKGGIKVEGSLRCDSPDPRFSQVIFMTESKLEINGENTEFHGTIMANDEVVVNAKNASVHGGITSRMKVTLNSENNLMEYKPLHSDLAMGFGATKTSESFSGRLQPIHYYQ